MNEIFDSIIINLNKNTRTYFNNQLQKYIKTKKTCNQFAKYIKSKNISNKTIQICYCKNLNNINLEQRSLQKLRKFFKETSNYIIYNFLDHKINYNQLLVNAKNILRILTPSLKQYIYRNNLTNEFIKLDIYTTFNLLNKIIKILKSFLDHTFPRQTSPFINKLNNISNKIEEDAINMELNRRFEKLVKLFSMRFIFLVSHDYEDLNDIYNLSFTDKKIFYVGFVTKMINIMIEYMKIVNSIEIVSKNINTTLETEILTLSSETDSVEDSNKTNSIIDSYEDSIILNK
jgi:hypothetical protein